MRAALPAEKKHYRKGLALGMTLAETFSVLVFILLLACATLLGRETFSRKQAEEGLADAEVDRAILEGIALGGDSSWINTDVWLEEARRQRRQKEEAEARAEDAERAASEAFAREEAARALLAGVGLAPEGVNLLLDQADQIVRLSDSVARSGEALRRQAAQIDSLELLAEETGRFGELLRTQLERKSGLTPAQADSVVARARRTEQLQRQLADARAAVRSADARRREAGRLLAMSAADSLDAATDSLERAVESIARERDDAVGRAKHREDQLRQLRRGSGIDPPPCWYDEAARRPQFIFRVELTDGGMKAFRAHPPGRDSDPAVAHALALEEGREYAPEDFARLAAPIYALGLARTESFGPAGCRFWVQPVDRTGHRKDVFQERERQLWRHFWFRW